MVFKDRKIPKHLIIQEEYEIRRKPRFGFFKFLFFSLLLVCVSWVISKGIIQI